MHERREAIQIDLSTVTTSEDLQDLLARSLNFPDFYGRNWDAFGDAITGLVEMPHSLRFMGWETLQQRLPDEPAQLRSCLDDMRKQYPQTASSVEYA